MLHTIRHCGCDLSIGFVSFKFNVFYVLQPPGTPYRVNITQLVFIIEGTNTIGCK